MLVTYLLTYMILCHNRGKHQNNVRKNNNVEERNPTRKTRLGPWNTSVNKIASNAWLKAGELFPETAGFMIATQNQAVSTTNFKRHILKDPNTTNDICRKCRQKQKLCKICMSCTSSGRLHPSSQSSSQHCPSRIGYQMWTVKGATSAIIKDEPQSVLENANY
jgi:hypothetical protein